MLPGEEHIRFCSPNVSAAVQVQLTSEIGRAISI